MSEEKQKTEYEELIEEFKNADKAFAEAQQKLLSGQLVVELMEMTRDPNQLKQQWDIFIQQLRTLLEDRNAKLTSAKNAMRQAVQLTPTQWRGPEGASTQISFDGFGSCSSVTKRTFDPNSLLNGTAKHGLQERLLSLTARDKDGKEYKLVEQKWSIDYEGVMSWLKAHKLEDVIDGAYDEKESTPQVKGPKPLSFLGDPKGD